MPDANLVFLPWLRQGLASRFVSELAHALDFIEAEQVKHRRPGDCQHHEQQDVFHGDARRKETLRIDWKLRKIDGNEHD